jgi:hypothetical protein
VAEKYKTDSGVLAESMKFDLATAQPLSKSSGGYVHRDTGFDGVVPGTPVTPASFNLKLFTW